MKPHLWYRRGVWHCAVFLWFEGRTTGRCGLISGVATAMNIHQAYDRFTVLER